MLTSPRLVQFRLQCSGCGKLCRCDAAVIEPCFNEVLEHDSAIELNDEPMMPDLKFDEPDEFMLLQAQNTHSRRAAYGVNGAKPGVQVSGSKPAKLRSQPSKTDKTTSYNKLEEDVNIHPSQASSNVLFLDDQVLHDFPLYFSWE